VSWLICSWDPLWSDALHIGKIENSISWCNLEQGGLQSVYTLSRSFKGRNCVRYWKCVGGSIFYSAWESLTSFLNEVIFIMRLYAIYSRSLTVVLFVGCLLAAELAVKIVRCVFSLRPRISNGYSSLFPKWAFTDGTSLVLPEGSFGTSCWMRNWLSPRRSCRVYTRWKASQVWTSSLSFGLKCIQNQATSRRFVFTWVAELVFGMMHPLEYSLQWYILIQILLYSWWHSGVL